MPDTNYAYTDVANTFSDAPQTIQINSDSNTGLYIEAHSTSQGASLIEVKNKSGNVVAIVDRLGALVAPDNGGQLYNVVAYGAVGDGTTDDTSAINSAISAALSASNTGGTVIYFPVGKYKISSTISFTTTPNALTFLGAAAADQYSQAASLLFYSASDSSSLFALNGSISVTFRNLGFRWTNASYSGTLLDFSQNGASGNTTYCNLIDCNIGPEGGGVTTTPAYLLNLDSGYGFSCIRTSFYGGQYAVLGRASSSSFNNCTLFEQCNFKNSVNPPIHNPHQAWAFKNCIFEPLYSNPENPTPAAGAIICDSSCPSNGLSLESCWLGDDSSGLSGSWITWTGTGLAIICCRIGVNALTTALSIATNNCYGISLIGNSFNGNGGQSIAIQFGTTTGHTGFVYLANSFVDIDTPIAGTIPPHSIYDIGGGVIIDAPTITDLLTAGPASFEGSLSGNLLSQTMADFETNSVGYWSLNDHASPAALNLGSGNAWHGSYVMAVTATTGITTEMSINQQGSGTSGLVASSPSQQITGLAHFLLPSSGSTPRQIQIDLYAYDSGAAGATRFATSGAFTSIRDSSTGWTALSVTGYAPATVSNGHATAFVGMIIRWTDTSDLSVGEVHYVDGCAITYGPPQPWTLPGTGVTPTLQIANGHLVSGGQTPSVTAGSAAGSSGASVTISGNEISGLITITTGTTGLGTGTLAELSFVTSFAAAPHVALTPANANAAGLQWFSNETNAAVNHVTVDTNTTPAASTAYALYYHVVGQCRSMAEKQASRTPSGRRHRMPGCSVCGSGRRKAIRCLLAPRL